MCMNEKIDMARESCCKHPSDLHGHYNCQFTGERVTYATAEARCKAASDNGGICDWLSIDSFSKGCYIHGASFWHWTNQNCSIHVKVRHDGHIAIVHNPNLEINNINFEDYEVFPAYSKENSFFFKVAWGDAGYPSSTCDTSSCEVVSDGCLCNVTIDEQAVFSSEPTPLDIISKLKIGSFSNNFFDKGTYKKQSGTKSDIMIYHKKGGVPFDKDTIFFVKDYQPMTFFKNALSNVIIDAYQFRNPPQFINPAQPDARDAHYETDAVLMHYVFHPNTPPFIAIRFIQRFGISNPSPDYIQRVATAFQRGMYKIKGVRFGDGKYGNLGAMTAAVILDEEARTVALDADFTSGALLEPMLKLVAFMRAMEFKADEMSPEVALVGLHTKIGQAPHSSDTVFSFFLPDYASQGKIKSASLVSPEAQVMTGPKIINFLNGIISLVELGLTSCYGGLGAGTVGTCKGNLQDFSRGRLHYTPSSTITSEIVDELALLLTAGRLNAHTRSLIAKIYDASRIRVSYYIPDFSWYVLPPSGLSPYIPYKTEMIKSINFRNHGGIFAGSGRNDLVAALFEGNLNFSSSGTYNLCITSSDGSKLYFDGVLLVDNDGRHHDRMRCNPIETSGIHEITIEYFDIVQMATMIFEWQTPTASDKTVVPSDAWVVRSEFNADSFRYVQSLVATSPEFHSTNIVQPDSERRPAVPSPKPLDNDYKAIVYVLLDGGLDSYNILVPHSGCTGYDLYEEYRDIRGPIALDKDSLLPISASSQPCKTFGLHPNLKAIQNLYNDGDLSFFANMGMLQEHVTKANWSSKTEKIPIFSHTQKVTIAELDIFETTAGRGVCGRMADILSQNGYSTGLTSIAGKSAAMISTFNPVSYVDPRFYPRFNPLNLTDPLKSYAKDINGATTLTSGLHSETWSTMVYQSFAENNILFNVANTNLNTKFPETNLGYQFQSVAKLIKEKNARGTARDIFYTKIFGFDTHGDPGGGLWGRTNEIDGALSAFSMEMKKINEWNNVTVVFVSEFGRTLFANTAQGSDHAWGGNYFIAGGSVAGQKVHGQYPNNLTIYGDLVFAPGIVIPKLPWEAMWNGIAEWFGVNKTAELDEVLPNRNTFPGDLLTSSDLFL
mmetsp:Transcript_1494/g.3130  ORF Transcript_1494/g.3130 Transcript_1494/m.3130 type:complete len:1117 (-) Transcript_1494:133-3483(-)